MNNHVFVYGTLMQGQSNHRWLGKSGVNSECLGCSETISFYRMVTSTNGIPAVLLENPISTIKGELYKVTSRVLEHLDALEHNGQVYQRVQVKVRRLFGKPSILAWLYFGILPVWRNSLIIPSGDYRRPNSTMTKGYIETKKNGKSVRLVELNTGKPLTGWHRNRTACYDEFGKKKRKEKKDGDRSNRSSNGKTV